MWNPLNWPRLIANFMLRLATDSNSSTSSWVYATTATVFCFGWLLVTLAIVYRICKFGQIDGTVLTYAGGLATVIAGFATYTKVSKLTIDGGKQPNAPASIETLGASVNQDGTK